jgi:hypothetical protein
MILKRKELDGEFNDEALQRKKAEKKIPLIKEKKNLSKSEETFDLFEESKSDDEEEKLENVNESFIKGVQIIDDEEREGFKLLYKFSSKTTTTAYYKCMSSSCGGRAAARYSLAKDDNEIYAYRFDEDIRITTPCTIKYEEHPWEKNKQYLDHFEVDITINLYIFSLIYLMLNKNGRFREVDCNKEEMQILFFQWLIKKNQSITNTEAYREFSLRYPSIKCAIPGSKISCLKGNLIKNTF